MAINVSTGLRRAMLMNYGLMSLMNRGRILLFTGAQPATADYEEQGRLVGYISSTGRVPYPENLDDGLGLRLDDLTVREDGPWIIRGVASGEIGWWRFVWNGEDDGRYSEYYPRIDGLARDSLVLNSYNIYDGERRNVNEFAITFPGTRLNYG